MTYMTLALLAVLGTLVRFRLGDLNAIAALPVGTLLANFLGCFLIGWISVTKSLSLSAEMKVIVMVGLLGALTTFSGFALELMDFLERQRYFLGAIYFLTMNLGCLLLVYLGRRLALSA